VKTYTAAAERAATHWWPSCDRGWLQVTGCRPLLTPVLTAASCGDSSSSDPAPADSINIKVKVARTRLPSVGFRSWSRFLAVSLQVMWVINPAGGWHYFPPGPQLPLQPLTGLLPISLLGEQRHNGCEQFAWQRRGCDLNPCPSVHESSMLTTLLPSHQDSIHRFNSLFSRTTRYQKGKTSLV